jgi:hypothetical protein
MENKEFIHHQHIPEVVIILQPGKFQKINSVSLEEMELQVIASVTTLFLNFTHQM